MNNNHVVDKVRSHIDTNRLIEKGDQIIAGVSGGADSVCLLCVLKEIYDGKDTELIAVHINHGIRETAIRDQRYVEQLCKELNVKCVVVKVDAIKEARNLGISTEEAGRILRYEAFASQIRDGVSSKIAVAHNMEDNAETVIHNLVRGTGIKGMCGIPTRRDNIIRPLLCLTRSEIEGYLTDKGISFCTDETNLTDDYTRNKIRHNVVPYLANQINHDAVSNIRDMSQIFEGAEDFLECETKRALDELFFDGILDRDGFIKLHDYMKTRVVHSILGSIAGTRKDIARIHIKQCIELMDKQVGRSLDLPYGIRAERCYTGISFTKDTDGQDACNDMLLDNVSMELRDFPYTEGMSIPCDKYTKWFDYDIISSIVSLRAREAGDYLIVDDAGSRKKLKDYFINEKIPSNVRAKLPLVADGSHIMWVVGYRISSHYKITNATRRVLEIKITEGVTK